MDEITSHEKKGLKKKLKEEQELKESRLKNKAEFSRKIKIYVLSIIILLILIFIIYKIAQPDEIIMDNRYDTTNAKVIIEEFSDFQCPFCGRAASTVRQIKEAYQNDVVIMYKHFPLPSHTFAQKAAEASECARDQGKFWEYHDILFENQNSLSILDLKQHASNLGLNVEQFNRCLDSGDKKDIVKKDLLEGQNKGVQGTPSFLINGKKLVGAQPFSEFKKVIDKELQ